MQAELIAIGDEILIGQTVDTNSAFIATQLNENGVTVKQKRVIADKAEAIKRALDEILPETQLVFMTGGLGPTKDDITKKTLTEYFGGKLVFNEKVYQNIERLFSSFNRQPSAAHRTQAELPDTCLPILNKMGTASGMRFERGGRFYFSLPGVPYETEHLVKDEIIPWINENLSKGVVVHRTVLTQGVPESDLAERLVEWENNLPEGISLAYLPSPGIVKLRLSAYTGEQGEVTEKIEEEVAKLKAILGPVVFGENADTLEEVIGSLLKEQGATVSTAESCTGGYIAHLLTQVPGSSETFKGSIVSYAEEAKENLLEVPRALIDAHGAVSQQVAEAMVQGARKKLLTDYAVATTGYAGPSGGDEQQPVGTVWIAVGGPQRMVSRQFNFGKNRQRNIRKAALMGLDMLRRELNKIE